MKRILPLLLLTTAIVALTACNKTPSEVSAANDTANTADAIYSGGDIITVNDAQPNAEAIAVKDGKILFVGSLVEANKFKGTGTRSVDLAGKTLMPSFIDPHSHYINSLLVANQVKLYAPPVGPGKDVDSIIAALKQFAETRKIPKGELIIGYGYDDTVMPDGRLLNRDDLDAAFPNNPVRVDHVSMHGAVLNSLALKKYGYSAETKTPEGGVIVRKPGTNEPFGLIMETAYLPVVALSESMTPEQEITWSKAGQLLYAEAGITTAHEGATHLPQLEIMQRASDAGTNIIDIVAFPFITDLDKILEKFPVSSWGKYSNHFKIGGVKITGDGSPQGKTAFFTTPYLTGGPGGEKDWKGEPTFPAEMLTQAVKKGLRLGSPIELSCQWRCRR